LNVFAYTGGFSVSAAHGGATRVTSLDINSLALEGAQRNFDHNLGDPAVQSCPHEVVCGDAFQLLDELKENKQTFDLIIVDPPSFAKEQSQIRSAILAYQRLTRLSLDLLRKGGMLVQASCSSRVNGEAFFSAVHQAAGQIGRKLKVIERTAHPIDHPIGYKEAAYLKCLYAIA
jgi:23S rRNA (cytosine1962-C5)-methyltransferase